MAELTPPHAIDQLVSLITTADADLQALPRDDLAKLRSKIRLHDRCAAAVKTICKEYNLKEPAGLTKAKAEPAQVRVPAVIEVKQPAVKKAPSNANVAKARKIAKAGAIKVKA
ncbi:hypothetical protein CAOG_07302 [Capsaspora owczarzaki ATCC 30864]|uniref:hypothetical protein n=1 Tax=Capsaspora owczarzaki (strain ATCC 30864) TaxID=595528 RepID=UPI0001FE3CFE|nr:hypothetical protein CAOG_07302 [Capsaspora owczarzaki ATCC 30864]|eukprot:XP_004343161.1 hypothetical protein CAOG_07302 [Capsaspora owczarzaki ATCC 30864]